MHKIALVVVLVLLLITLFVHYIEIGSSVLLYEHNLYSNNFTIDSADTTHPWIQWQFDRKEQKEAFVRKFINCSDHSEAEISKPLSHTCALKLNVTESATDSIDFDRLEQRFVERPEHSVQAMNSSCVKYILLWKNSPAGESNINLQNPRSTMFRAAQDNYVWDKCPVNNCAFVADSERTIIQSKKIAAVLLHLWWILKEGEHMELPTREDFSNGQFVMWAGEAPVRLPNGIHKFSELIDMVVSYRRDADVIRTRGYVYPLKNNLPEETWKDKINFAGKKKMAAWLVSNCNFAPSYRNSLTEQLQRHGVSVDIYGSCGPYSCSKDESDNCYRSLELQYKFYLSFENSLCNHYVTEKFYNVLRFNMIPVTYGLGYEVTGVPKSAYIDVFDFPDVKTLSQYLLFLASNETEYSNYFRWKSLYGISPSDGNISALCKVCELLWSRTRTQVPVKYRDMRAWYSTGQCLDVEQNDALRTFLGL